MSEDHRCWIEWVCKRADQAKKAREFQVTGE